MALVYILVLSFIVAALVKVTCVRDMSLLVTFVMIATALETVSLIMLTVRVNMYKDEGKDEGKEEGMNLLQKSLFAFVPLSALIILFLCNAYVVARHL